MWSLTVYFIFLTTVVMCVVFLIDSGELLFCCLLQGIIQLTPTGISLWMGGHDSITEGGWEWTDSSPFRYIHWNTG